MADSSKDFSKMKVADLKRELKLRGLSSAGNKQELQERLQSAASESADSSLLLLEDGPGPDTEDILNEDDVLAEDDDEDDDDAELGDTPDDGCASSSLKRNLEEELEEELDSGVTSSPEAKDGTTVSSPSTEVIPAKKIVLNRKGPVAVPAPSPGKENVAVSKSEEPSGKNVVKLSAISMKERLELRAAKFGTPASDSAKKEARAARFGGGATSTSVSSGAEAPNADVLKKRAERFGLLPGSAAEKVEMEEKKRKRLERFGLAESKSTATNGSAAAKEAATPAALPKSNKVPITAPTGTDASAEEKKRLRAERFKASVATK